MTPATLFGTTQQQRTRLVVASYFAEDLYLNTRISGHLAELLGVETWVVDLMDAADLYRRIEHRFDYQVITLLGHTLIHRYPDGTEGHTIPWPTPNEPTAADLYTWALRRAASTRDHLDPSILKLARQLLCAEAGIASLDVLHSEVRDHRLNTTITRELAHV